MPKNDIECRCTILKETAMAYQVARSGPTHWVPKSQISYCRKTKNENGTVDAVMMLPEWLVEKDQLWDLVP